MQCQIEIFRPHARIAHAVGERNADEPIIAGDTVDVNLRGLACISYAGVAHVKAWGAVERREFKRIPFDDPDAAAFELRAHFLFKVGIEFRHVRAGVCINVVIAFRIVAWFALIVAHQDSCIRILGFRRAFIEAALLDDKSV